MSKNETDVRLGAEIDRAKLYKITREQFLSLEQIRNHLTLYERSLGWVNGNALDEFKLEDFDKENVAMRLHGVGTKDSYVEVALLCYTGRCFRFKYYPDTGHVVALPGH